jgi:hypothetical protein
LGPARSIGDFKKPEFMLAEMGPATQFTVAAEGTPDQPLVRPWRADDFKTAIPICVWSTTRFLILASRDIIPPLKLIGGDAVWAISIDQVSHQRMP